MLILTIKQHTNRASFSQTTSKDCRQNEIRAYSQNTFILIKRTKTKTDGLQPDVKWPTYSHFVFFGV